MVTAKDIDYLKHFVFWVIVHGIADGAFKGILSVDELLSKQLPPGRESFTLQWMDRAKDLPFFHMVLADKRISGQINNGHLK